MSEEKRRFIFSAENMTEYCGGAKIYLKREDLNHTGAHKINNTIGQALLAVRMGSRKRLSLKQELDNTELQQLLYGALLGLSVASFFMGEEDVRRQKLNVFRMELLGAKVEKCSSR